MSESKGLSHIVRLKNGNNFRVDCLGAGIFHIRVGIGECCHESGLNRYGIIRIEPDIESADVTFNEMAGGWTVTTPEAVLHIRAEDGAIGLKDGNGKSLLEAGEHRIRTEGRGFEASFRLAQGERLYGLGDVDRDCIQRRGKIYEMIIKNVIAYAPIPFLMSSSGWAIFLNTTWFHTVDAGATNPDILRFKAEHGYLDFYLIAGEYPKVLLDRYTRITGKPTMLPEWAYGLTFICDERGLRARDMLYEAYEFRRHGIPCDIIGLEPGWMEKYYDFSVDKEWSKERFHIPFWLKGKDYATFSAALKKMGFKLSLWLCCDYDLSEHEERQLKKNAVERNEPAKDKQSQSAFIDDERLKGAVYLDKITKPGEGWFEHLKKFVNDGARAFKLDAANQVERHPDRKWFNGMDDREIHNLNPVLYGKQMSRGFAEYTKKRPMINIALGCAGIQQYAAMWAGDIGGGAEPLTSLLNHGFCGSSNVTTDMQVWDEQGIHFGFLQTWCQINSWHLFNEPWFQGEHLAAIFTAYARLRYRLMPYIYSMARLANKTGFPVMRAMPLVFPDDPKSDALILQYMLGDAFLTTAFTDKIHLPAGEWFDYWTGKIVKGPATLPVTYPAGKGGALYARAGAIIPMGPDMAYWGEKPMDTLLVDVFPGNRDEPFVLYEDDGDTEAYLEGKSATTMLNQHIKGNELMMSVAPREGCYYGMPEQRCYRFQIHCAQPREVRVGSTPVSDWRYDEAQSLLIMPPIEAPLREVLEVAIVN